MAAGRTIDHMNDLAALPSVTFGSAREAAADLNVAAKAAKDGPFFVFPFNKYEPDDSTWWLSPKDENALNPAYRLGKIAIGPKRLAAPGALFIGLHVEKGVEDPAAEAFLTSGHGRRMIMEPDWTWHRFLEALSGGKVAEQATEAEVTAGGPLTVEVTYSPQDPPSNEKDDPRVRTTKSDLARFEYSGGELSLIDEALELNLFTGCAGVRSLVELADKITTTPKLDWAWVEVLIGQRFAQASAGEPAWSASEIWSKTCRPWRHWLR